MQSYEHFTLLERESLYKLRKEGLGSRAIARELGRSPSSVSRELRRHTDKDGQYNSWNATLVYLHQRKNSRKKFLFETESELKRGTIEQLQRYWPPETIVAVWKKEHPGARLSHTSVYRAIKAGMLPKITEREHLRRRGKLKFKAKNCAPVKVDRRIGEWPVEVVDRGRVGDWEGDTIRGAPGKGVILTLVDRKSRFLVARLCKNKRAVTIEKAILSAMRGKPAHTMSFDNGSEFSTYHEVEDRLKTTVYFAAPRSPWQRGTNENLNGLLRFFFPKGANLLTFSPQYLEQVVDLINDRPRKCLGWLSPQQIFAAKCCT
jgi:IS30 family transposase